MRPNQRRKASPVIVDHWATLFGTQDVLHEEFIFEHWQVVDRWSLLEHAKCIRLMIEFCICQDAQVNIDVAVCLVNKSALPMFILLYARYMKLIVEDLHS